MGVMVLMSDHCQKIIFNCCGKDSFLFNGGGPFTCHFKSCHRYIFHDGIQGHSNFLHHIFNHLLIHGSILWSPGNSWNGRWLIWLLSLLASPFSCPLCILCNVFDCCILGCSSILRHVCCIDRPHFMALESLLHSSLLFFKKFWWCDWTKGHWQQQLWLHWHQNMLLEGKMQCRGRFIKMGVLLFSCCVVFAVVLTLMVKWGLIFFSSRIDQCTKIKLNLCVPLKFLFFDLAHLHSSVTPYLEHLPEVSYWTFQWAKYVIRFYVT